MFKAKVKKWGNSMGIIIPSKIIKEHNIREDQELVIEIRDKSNPLKELFGFGKDKPISRKEFEEFRKSMESKYT